MSEILENIPELTTNKAKDSMVNSCSILELDHEQAKEYFLKETSYCTLELPIYFKFENAIQIARDALSEKELKDLRKKNPSDLDDVNYKIITNKDGQYAWRSIQLIHPVIYVSLVNELTKIKNWDTICKKFKEFTECKNIKCFSVPRKSSSKNSDKAEQITNWWDKIEQKSIELALDYDYLHQTDITDCYGSIYTHSIAWALHGRDTIKNLTNKSDQKYIGNVIDRHLQYMSSGQTNGIPEGSALMDFIAEMVLGYADILLDKKIKETESTETPITNYQIIRYRDDYRIFTNDPQDGEKIIKFIAEIMMDLGLKLNAEKTKSTSEVINGSIKIDKLYYIKQNYRIKNFQKRLLLIHELAHAHKNSGSLKKALDFYDEDLRKHKKIQGSVLPIISIATDIAYKNPKTYPQIASIISLLIKLIDQEKEKTKVINKIINKFKSIPNNGHLFIFLQRITLALKISYDFNDRLCKHIAGKISYDSDEKLYKNIAEKEDQKIWNYDWLNDNLREQLSDVEIFDIDTINNLPEAFTKEETELFKTNDNYN
jgi:RNA-directed DNA polymerase